ncbi:hypothetical protein EXIGLDRAFT_838454 [Exidia glandulosa HHB12029]|uniref:ubiquitinyl hydrolase 1 n=1 Tax=Exidia glandulosa HHB12029 TaxID=1314781 RepID=A0A165FUP6_EXIGL|nr:hypothetical protein EXIGLDRAFT_838454 [Exidia glandulosa HHB12029]
MSLPSPPSEPVGSRKRQRSHSTSSETSSSKRAASEEPSASALSDGVRSPDSLRAVPSLSPMNISSPPDADIDSYMAEQEGGDVDELDPALRGEQRLLQIQQLKKQPLIVGDTWYMVSKAWLDKWESLCTATPLKSGVLVTEHELGPVDNSALYTHSGALNHQLMEDTDFVFVPESVWKLFEDWYGASENPLPRKVIQRSVANEKRIEMYPPRIKLYRLVAGDGKDLSGASELTLETSKATKVHAVLKEAATLLGISSDIAQVRAWRIDGTDSQLDSGSEYPAGRLEDDNATHWPPDSVSPDAALEVTDLDHGDVLVIECKVNGQWIVPEQDPPPVFNSDFFASKFGTTTKTLNAPVSTSSNAIAVRSRPAPPAIKRGTMGLINLGNTCFMNSALQCLAHTPALTEYFLSGVFKDELNPTNPLGMQGAIAEAFGSLLQRLYDTGSSSMAPREFKTALQRFAPQFIGYQQHDSQELLAFLLDGLHEDLNRILKKPYVENPDWEGGGEKELIKLARTTWDGYLSVVVDLFAVHSSLKIDLIVRIPARE